MDTLRHIAVDTEEDFLLLGERMQDFYKRAKNMSDLSAQVAMRLSAEDMNKAIEMLQVIFNTAKSQTERSAQYTVTLEQMLDKLADIEGRLYGFDKTVRNLHVLCNFIRIENARLGQDDSRFDNLGDDVRKLAVTITSKSLDLLERSASLSQLIRQYLKRIKDYEAQQQTQARLILESTTGNVSAMTEECEVASKALGKIASQWEFISGNIGEIVSSMQFHDITRQRLEHIHEALSELNADENETTANAGEDKTSPLRSGFRGRNGNRRNGSLQRISRAVSLCELQKAQLVHADNDLLSAVNRMSDNLRRIADNVLITSEEIKKTAKVSGGNSQSFLQKLESDLLSLADAIATYETLDRNLSSYMRTATGAIMQMSSFIHDIQRIGIDMHMIALNASIRSARIGQSGATLGVLAESILKLSADTVHSIEEVSNVLSDIVEEARLLSQQSTDETNAVAAASTDGISDRIERLLSPIRMMNDDVTALLSRIDREGKDLAQDIGTTVENLAIHENMSLKIREVISGLTEVTADIRSTTPLIAHHAGEEELHDLAGRYTMEQERQIHQKMTAKAAAGALLTEAAVIGASEEEQTAEKTADWELTKTTDEDAENLGDNVELF
jgi:methyl-accepting chemotaxis protein